jgi:hypothetical protein
MEILLQGRLWNTESQQLRKQVLPTCKFILQKVHFIINSFTFKVLKIQTVEKLSLLYDQFLPI